MEVSRTWQYQKNSPLFTKLPPELRRIICTLAVTKTTPIELLINYYGGDRFIDGSKLSHVRVYTVDDFRMLAVCRDLRSEMIDVLYAENSFDIPLSREDAGGGLCMHQIDLRRIRRCRLVLPDLQSNECYPHMDMWHGSYPLCWYHHLQSLVATLIFNGHHLQALLVECREQVSGWLIECLNPMVMLRGVGIVHFRSDEVRLYPWFAFLEANIMSDWEVPFSNKLEFRKQTRPGPSKIRYDRSGLPVSRWMPSGIEGEGGSKEEREATAMVLYKRLGIEGEMVSTADERDDSSES